MLRGREMAHLPGQTSGERPGDSHVSCISTNTTFPATQFAVYTVKTDANAKAALANASTALREKHIFYAMHNDIARELGIKRYDVPLKKRKKKGKIRCCRLLQSICYRIVVFWQPCDVILAILQKNANTVWSVLIAYSSVRQFAFKDIILGHIYLLLYTVWYVIIINPITVIFLKGKAWYDIT